MRVLIVGGGRMGCAIEAAARAAGVTVAGVITAADNPAGAALTRERLADVSVVLEFTAPAAAPANLLALAHAEALVVCGTTGWDAHRGEIEAAFRAGQGALLTAGNFSLGVQVMQRALRTLMSSAAQWPGVDATLVERHHRAKRDAPSGTALQLQRVAQQAAPQLALPITSIRSGTCPGEHTVVLDAPDESLTLSHVVRDRRVFAHGALTAAHWLQGRRGIFTFDDLFTATEGVAP